MRDRQAGAVIGGRAQGKSTKIRQVLDRSYKADKDQVLILTPTVPPAYKDLDELTLKELQTTKWTGMARYYNHKSAKQMLVDIHDLCIEGRLKRGCIVFEDCTNYIEPWPAESIRNFLVNMRMFDLDLIFTTHALRFLPKFCRGMVNYVTVFKTAEVYEKPSELRAYDYPNYNNVYKAWKEVMDAAPVNGFIQPNKTILTGI